MQANCVPRPTRRYLSTHHAHAVFWLTLLLPCSLRALGVDGNTYERRRRGGAWRRSRGAHSDGDDEVQEGRPVLKWQLRRRQSERAMSKRALGGASGGGRRRGCKMCMRSEYENNEIVDTRFSVVATADCRRPLPTAGGRCRLPAAAADCRRPLPTAGGRCRLPAAAADCRRPLPTAGGRCRLPAAAADCRRPLPTAGGRCRLPAAAADCRRPLPTAGGRCRLPAAAADCRRPLPTAGGRCRLPAAAADCRRPLPTAGGRCRLPAAAADCRRPLPTAGDRCRLPATAADCRRPLPTAGDRCRPPAWAAGDRALNVPHETARSLGEGGGDGGHAPTGRGAGKEQVGQLGRPRLVRHHHPVNVVGDGRRRDGRLKSGRARGRPVAKDVGGEAGGEGGFIGRLDADGRVRAGGGGGGAPPSPPCATEVAGVGAHEAAAPPVGAGASAVGGGGERRADVGQGRAPEGGGGGARRREGGLVEHLPRGGNVGAVCQKRVGGARHGHGPKDGRGGGGRCVGNGGERCADERGEAHPNLDRRRCHGDALSLLLRRFERRPQVPHVVQQPLGGTKERVLVRLDATEAACERRQVRLHRHEARGTCVAHDRCGDGDFGGVQAPHDGKVDAHVQRRQVVDLGSELEQPMSDRQGVEVHNLAASDRLRDGIDGGGLGVGDEARPRTLKGAPPSRWTRRPIPPRRIATDAECAALAIDQPWTLTRGQAPRECPRRCRLPTVLVDAAPSTVAASSALSAGRSIATIWESFAEAEEEMCCERHGAPFIGRRGCGWEPGAELNVSAGTQATSTSWSRCSGPVMLTVDSDELPASGVVLRIAGSLDAPAIPGPTGRGQHLRRISTRSSPSSLTAGSRCSDVSTAVVGTFRRDFLFFTAPIEAPHAISRSTVVGAGS
ncbi:hypothetical protein BU14_0353s0021 [Porphyra umbilicalis]|uniref:Uncharacterized protein n=1 Tax=Porphyra umbilicalis TaxID=2786 RepID=A0A1X6NXS1_PORUM|nr:hypothetical protein BU14_0353s0021 [Porphyra umbilicalis]|eukprot:OSX73377.1 hypothetical protein BU14_0353s0021 [Porphyra umbilicalis]